MLLMLDIVVSGLVVIRGLLVLIEFGVVVSVVY